MARGYEDYSRPARKEQVSILPSVLYNLGRAFFVDRFDQPQLNWFPTGSAGFSVGLETRRFYIGGACCRMTSTAAEDDEVNIVQFVAFPEKKKIALQAQWFVTNSKVKYFRVGFDFTTNDLRYRYFIRYVMADQKWQIRNRADDWVDIPGADQIFYNGDFSWNHLKIEIDLVNFKYLRLNSNERVFDLTDVEPFRSADPGGSIAYWALSYITGASGATTGYVDEVIFTEED